MTIYSIHYLKTMTNSLEKNKKKSFTKGKVSVFKQINRLKNACKLAEKETESSKWEELFEKEMLYNGQIMTDIILTGDTEEVFVGGHRYHCVC